MTTRDPATGRFRSTDPPPERLPEPARRSSIAVARLTDPHVEHPHQFLNQLNDTHRRFLNQLNSTFERAHATLQTDTATTLCGLHAAFDRAQAWADYTAAVPQDRWQRWFGNQAGGS